MRSLFVLVLFALPLVAAPVPKSVKKNPHPLNGEWVVVEWHVDDARMPLTDTVRWTIDGDKLTVRGEREQVPDGFLANVSRTMTRPEGGAENAIDFNIAFNDGSGTILRPAALEFDRDRFTLCMTSTTNGARPADCKPVRGTITYTLKRADAAK